MKTHYQRLAVVVPRGAETPGVEASGPRSSWTTAKFDWNIYANTSSVLHFEQRDALKGAARGQCWRLGKHLISAGVFRSTLRPQTGQKAVKFFGFECFGAFK